jgi:hypothetical protein
MVSRAKREKATGKWLAALRFWLLVASLSPRRTGFDLRTVYVRGEGFLVLPHN